MRKIYLLLLFLFTLTQLNYTQTLLIEENFNYTVGTNLTSNGWIAHSGSDTNPVTVNGGGLIYSDYAGSGMGNAALLDNTGEDINHSFTSQSSGSLYFSFLVNVSNISPGYFIHLYKSPTIFAARVFIRDDSGHLQFGISNTSTANFAATPTNFTIETTYLCVVKYTFADESCSLWVFSSGLPTSEFAAGLPEVISAGSGRSSITAIALRQYSTVQDIIVDGIRISDSWSQAPLPVELTSFTASAISKGVMLNWSTATEVNNYGFSIERKSEIDNRKWQEIGFTDGHGNSNSPKDYSFMDSSPSADEVSYRLKQIDIDGAFEYSDVVTVTTKFLAKYGLYQNHPNPFNPSTQINYSLAKDSRVNITVYNSLGQKVIELLNKKQSAGIYSIELNGGNLASGLYFYRLETPDYSKTMKMVLIK